MSTENSTNSSSTAVCKVCSQAVDSVHRLVCCGCKGLYHIACTKLPNTQQMLSLPFFCLLCMTSLSGCTWETSEVEHMYCDMSNNFLVSKLQIQSQATYRSNLNRVFWAIEDSAVQKEAIFGLAGQVVSPCAIMMFVYWALEKRNYRPSTILGQLSALKSYYVTNSVRCDWESCHIKHIYARLKEKAKAAAQIAPSKHPVQSNLLRTLCQYFDAQYILAKTAKDKRLVIRNRTMFSLMFFALLRRSEVIALRVKDIRFEVIDGVECAVVFIAKSKTDRYGVGAEVVVSNKNSTGIPIVQYLKELINSLRFTNPCDRLFQSEQPDAKKYDYGFAKAGQCNSVFDDVKRKMIAFLSVDSQSAQLVTSMFEKITTHSFRKGGMNQLFENCKDIEVVMLHGRWKQDAVRVYQQSQLQFKFSGACCV